MMFNFKRLTMSFKQYQNINNRSKKQNKVTPECNAECTAVCCNTQEIFD